MVEVVWSVKSFVWDERKMWCAEVVSVASPPLVSIGLAGRGALYHDFYYHFQIAQARADTLVNVGNDKTWKTQC